MSNPFWRYDREIGEMEELTIYYEFMAGEERVESCTLHFASFPNHY